MTERLRGYLRPLSLTLLVVLACCPPLAYLLFGLNDAHQLATTTAVRVAEHLLGEGALDHPLWRYNTPKLIEHLRSYVLDSRIRGIELQDCSGARIELAEAVSDSPELVWGKAPVLLPTGKDCRVWVAVSTRGVYANSLLIFILSLAVAILLSGMVYFIPLRTVSAAERRIEELLEALHRSQDLRLRELARRAVQLQEKERRSIARELHDGAGQALTALRLNMQLLGDIATYDAQTGRLLDKSIGLVDEVLDEIRRSVARLGPAIIDEIGLKAALRRYVDDFNERTTITVEMTIEGLEKELPTIIESTCYRIVQEGLTNISRHANAKRAKIYLQQTDGRLRLAIEDDGCGFDPLSVEKLRGNGLRGISERVALLQGHFEVHSTPGRGTCLLSVLPLETAALAERNNFRVREGE